MNEPNPTPEEEGPRPAPPDAWKDVVMGQVSHPLVAPHPEPPEAGEDELTQAAMADPADVAYQQGDPRPTFWRVLVVVLIAVAALAVVFGFAR